MFHVNLGLWLPLKVLDTPLMFLFLNRNRLIYDRCVRQYLQVLTVACSHQDVPVNICRPSILFSYCVQLTKKFCVWRGL